MVDQNNNNHNTIQQKDQLAQQVLQDDVSISGQPPRPEIKQTKSGVGKFISPKKLLVILGLILVVLVIILAVTRFSSNTIAPSRGDGEIVWWTLKEDVDSLRPLVDEFERQNPNIRVVLRPQSETDYLERLANAINGNNPPEIFEIHKSWIPMFNQRLYPLPATVNNASDYNNDFYPVMAGELMKDEGLFAMPLYYDAIAFYVNQDIFTRAAELSPETWVELEALAPRLTQTGNNNLVTQSGVAMGRPENIDYWQEIIGLLMYQNGVNITQPDGNNATEVFGFFKSFSGTTWDQRLPRSTDYFAQGNVAMYFGPTREASNIINQNPNLRFRTEPLPQVPKGSPDDPDYSYTTYFVHGVSNNSGDRDSAWELLVYLTDRERLIELNEKREEKGLYPRIYPRVSMANLQNSDPILGTVIAMAYQARGWYLSDDRVEGQTSISDQISSVYATVLAGDAKNLTNLQTELRKILNTYGIRIN